MALALGCGGAPASGGRAPTVEPAVRIAIYPTQALVTARADDVPTVATGLAWRADYNVVLDGERADVDAWISLHNESAVSYRDAQVQLVVDDTPERPVPDGATLAPNNLLDGRGSMIESRPATPQVAAPSQPALRFRAFELPAVVDLPEGARRQVPWFGAPVRQVRATRSLEYDATVAAARVAVTVEVAIPIRAAMPPGAVRVYERRGARVALLGAGAIDAIEAGAPLRVAVGTAPSVRGTRSRTEVRADRTGRAVEQVEIELVNDGAAALTVRVREHFDPDRRWHIAAASTPATPAGPHAATFAVQVPARGRGRVTYRVVYTSGEIDSSLPPP